MVAGLARAGIWIEAVGDEVRCRPPGRLSTELREQLRGCKPRLLAALRSDQPSAEKVLTTSMAFEAPPPPLTRAEAGDIADFLRRRQMA